MSTIYGVSIPGKDLGPTFEHLDPQMVRVYDDQYKMTAVAKRGRPVAMSLRSWSAGGVANALAILPTGSTLSIKHEPEDDVAAGTLTLATWRDWQLRLAEAIAGSDRVGEVLPATILMGWTLDPRSRLSWTDYLTPAVVAALKGVPGAIAGWDSYVGPHQGGPQGPTVTPEQAYGDCLDLSSSLGLNCSFFETGVRVTPEAAASQALWWSRAFDYVAGREAYCFLLWNSSTVTNGVTNAYQIDAYPPLVAAWRSKMGPLFTQADLEAAVAAQKSAGQVALAAAVASQKATGDAALAAARDAAAATLQAAMATAAANLQDEQARSSAALTAAQAAATAKLTEVGTKGDASLAQVATALVTSRRTLKSLTS